MTKPKAKVWGYKGEKTKIKTKQRQKVSLRDNKRSELA